MEKADEPMVDPVAANEQIQSIVLLEKSGDKKKIIKELKIKDKDISAYGVLYVRQILTGVVRISDNTYIWELPSSFLESHKQLNIVPGYASGLMAFFKNAFRGETTLWNDVFTSKACYLIPNDNLGAIQDLRFFYWHNIERDQKRGVETQYKTLILDQLINYGLNIPANYNDIGLDSLSKIIERKINFISERFRFNDFVNDQIYNSLDYDGFKKIFDKLVETKYKHRGTREQALRVYNYIIERPLPFDQICKFFGVDQKSVIRMYIDRYNCNGSEVFDDFYENFSSAIFTAFIHRNIDFVTKYLYLDYNTEVGRDKVFLALYSYLMCASKTGVYLILSFLNEIKTVQPNDIVFSDVDYYRLNFYRDLTINTFYVNENAKPETQLKNVKMVNEGTIKTTGYDKIIPPINKEVKKMAFQPNLKEIKMKEIEYKERTDRLKLEESYALEVQRQKELLIHETYKNLDSSKRSGKIEKGVWQSLYNYFIDK